MATGIRTRPATKDYRNNFGRVFKKKKNKPKKNKVAKTKKYGTIK